MLQKKRALQESTNSFLETQGSKKKQKREDSSVASGSPFRLVKVWDKVGSFLGFKTKYVPTIDLGPPRAGFAFKPMPLPEQVPGPFALVTDIQRKPEQARKYVEVKKPPQRVQSEDEDEDAAESGRRREHKERNAVLKAAGKQPEPYKKRLAMGSRKHSMKQKAKQEREIKELAALGATSTHVEHTDYSNLSFEDYKKMRAVDDRDAAKHAMESSALVGQPSLLRNKSSSKKTYKDSMSRVEATLRRANLTEREPVFKPEMSFHDRITAQLQQIDLEDKPKTRRRKFPKKLSAEDELEVDATFRQTGVISSMIGAEVSARNLARLKGLQWLDDEVITMYAMLINARSKEVEAGKVPAGYVKEDFRKAFSFNSFFFKKLFDDGKGHEGVKRFTKKVDLFALDIVIVPVNVGSNHWVCAAINIAEKRIEYHDSMGGLNSAACRALRKYLQEEHRVKKGTPLDFSEWEEEYYDETVPQQQNGCDCGVFTCQFMESLSRNIDGFDFTQRDMPYIRRKMVLEIKRRQILPEPWE